MDDSAKLQVAYFECLAAFAEHDAFTWASRSRLHHLIFDFSVKNAELDVGYENIYIFYAFNG